MATEGLKRSQYGNYRGNTDQYGSGRRVNQQRYTISFNVSRALTQNSSNFHSAGH